MPVIVLGMHRSGTSAMTRCLNLMGLSVGPEEELLPPCEENPRGFWENRELTQLNDDILTLFNGGWQAPPYLSDSWWLDPRLGSLKRRATEVLQRVFHGTYWVWKDPRLCLTLPLWLEGLSTPPTVVFIHRNPLEVWKSLEHRNELTKSVSLALWTIYNRSALENMSSLPVFFVHYARLLEDPRECLERLRLFLARQGLDDLEPPPADALGGFLSGELRHWHRQARGLLRDADATADQKELLERLCECPCESDQFQVPVLPCKTAHLEHILQAQRDRFPPLMAELQTSQANQAELERQLGQLGERTVNLEQELEDARSDRARIQGECDLASTTRVGLEGELTREREQRAQLEAELETVRANQSELEQRLNRIPALEADLEQARARQAELQAQAERIPGLEAELAHARLSQMDLQGRVNQSEARQTALQAELRQAQDAVAILETQVERIPVLETEREDARRSHATAISELETHKRKIRELEGAVAQSQAQLAGKAEALEQGGQQQRGIEAALALIEQSGSYRLARVVSRCLPLPLKRAYRRLRRRRRTLGGNGDISRLAARGDDLRLSLVVPVSSNGEHLRAKIEACLAQTRPGDQIILEGDHPTQPAVRAVLNEYRNRPGVTIVLDEANGAADTEPRSGEVRAEPAASDAQLDQRPVVESEPTHTGAAQADLGRGTAGRMVQAESAEEKNTTKEGNRHESDLPHEPDASLGSQSTIEEQVDAKDVRIRDIEATLATIYGSKAWRALSVWRKVKYRSHVGYALRWGWHSLRHVGVRVSRSRTRRSVQTPPPDQSRGVLGCIEAPQPEHRLNHQVLVVAGWALGTECPIRSILVSCGGQAWRKVTYGLPRPDVLAAYGALADGTQPGFAMALYLSNSDDTTSLEVTIAAEFEDGRIVPWASRRITVSPEATPIASSEHDLPVIHTWQQQDPYLRWRVNNELSPALQRLMEQSAKDIVDGPMISVVVPVYNTPHRYLDACIQSIRDQIYSNWELCLADDASTDPAIRKILGRHAGGDSRIKACYREANGHIVAATNSALSLATGDFVAFLDHDDLLAPDALLHVAECLAAHPATDWVYTDEDKTNDAGEHYDPQFKGAWSPEMAITHNFAHHLSVMRRTLVQQVGSMRPGTEGCQDFDLYLRIAEATSPDRIRHVPFVCYHWRCHSESTASGGRQKSYIFDHARRAIEDALERRRIPAKVLLPDFADKNSLCLHRLSWEPTNGEGDSEGPAVTIVIPSRERPDLLASCLDSIERTIGATPVEVIVVDDESESQETLSFLESLSGRYSFPCRVVRAQRRGRGFNFSRLVNVGAREARGDYLLLLNNDIEATEPGWLDDMCGWLRIDGVGAVGPKLQYPDGSIQHAGIVVGCNNGLADHAFRGLGRGELGYLFLPHATRNCSAVTGACLLTRRDVFLELEGFNEENLGIEFNDVDYCLRLWQHGLRVVQSPAAVLTHHEGASRFGIAHSNREHMYFSQRWAGYDDPFYNPNLAINGRLFGVNPEYCAHADRVRRCRVLLFGHNFNLEGAPVFQMRLARWLRKRERFDVVVCAPRSGPLQEVYEREGVETRVVDWTGWQLNPPEDVDKEWGRFGEELNIDGFDVIGCNTLETFSAVEMARRRSLPVVWHIHESNTIDKYFAHLSRKMRKMICEDLAYAARVVFAARSSRLLLHPADRHGRFRVIPNGMPMSEIDRFQSEHGRRSLRDSYGISPDTTLISHIGTTCPRKGQHVFIEAARRILEQRPRSNLVFMMVGGRSGPYLSELQHRIALIAGDRVRLVMETAAYRDYLGMSDCFVCSSFEESFPLIILEAMAFGLPIVATDVFGNAEMLAHEGEALLVPAGDPVALAAGMLRVLDDPALAARLGDNGRCRVRRMYDNELLLPRIARQYREAALLKT